MRFDLRFWLPSESCIERRRTEIWIRLWCVSKAQPGFRRNIYRTLIVRARAKG
jgi:hypothetical protein